MQDYNNRFGGVERIYGALGADRISKAHICVVGIGGVGSWVCEALARSGVGKITLVDLDEVCVTNINRQIHAITETVGRSKVAVMKERLLQINPQIEVNAIEDFFTEKTKERVLSTKYDYLIDAIDSFNSKLLLIHECRLRNQPILTVGGAGGKVTPSLIRSGDLSETSNDPLLAKIRKHLKHVHQYSQQSHWGIDAVYSFERPRFPNKSGRVCYQKDMRLNGRLGCEGSIGSVSFLTGAMAFEAVSVALDRITQVQVDS